MLMRRFLPVALITLISAACAEAPERAPALTIQVDSTGRFPVIRSLGDAPVWRAEPVMSVGGAGAPEEEEFAMVRSVLLHRDGGVIVVDAREARVAEFGPTGEWRADWATKGAGPGEVSSPYSIAWLDDSLAVLDPGNSRIGILAPDRRWVRSFPVQPVTGGQHIRLYRDPPNAFWMWAVRPPVNGTPSNLFIRVTSGGVGDSLAVPRPQIDMAPPIVCRTADGGFFVFEAPLSAAHRVLIGPSGQRVVAMSNTASFAALTPAGDTSFRAERPHVAASVSDAEWSERTEPWRTFRERQPSVACEPAAPTRPEKRTLLEQWVFADDGALWVEWVTTSGRQVEVFGADGALQSRVEGLPALGAVEPSIVGDRVALVSTDSLGLATVHVYRIVK